MNERSAPGEGRSRGDFHFECRDVSKSFDGVPVLRDVSFRLRRGEVLGLVGENGAGKSTLMNVLGGVLRADAGAMTLDGSAYDPRDVAGASGCGLAFIHQELNLFSNLSVAHNLFLAALPRRRIGPLRVPVIDTRLLAAQAKEALATVGLCVDPATPVDRLAPGERQLVEVAAALRTEAKLIIFDEPTTSLTALEAQRLFALIDDLRRRGVSVIYISHTLEDVFQLCDRLVVLRDGRVVGEHAREAFDLDRVVAEMVGREIDTLYPPPSARAMDERERVVLAATGLTRAGALSDVSFRLYGGEILGVAGLMGSGRTELARVLFGLDPLDAGTIELDGERVETLSARKRMARGLVYITEDRRSEGLLMDATVLENVSLAALPRWTRPAGLLARRALVDAVRRVRGEVRLAGRDRQPARTLSGGNQQKVVLAKWLLCEPRVFLLDEPTRGIDVGARHEIYRLIRQRTAEGAGMLLISSEIEELIGMCDRIVTIRRGTLAASFDRGGFDREQIMKSAIA